MKILITGSNGFIGRNVHEKLLAQEVSDIFTYNSSDSIEHLKKCCRNADVVLHFAGINRTDHLHEFEKINLTITRNICDFVTPGATKIIYTSSIHANNNTPYGISKLKSENILEEFAKSSGSPVTAFRLPNVFGKWAKPYYNSAVATFVYNVANDIDFDVINPEKRIRLLYIDDLVNLVISEINKKTNGFILSNPSTGYDTTISEVHSILKSIHKSRINNSVLNVGSGLIRALYATYLSYLPTSRIMLNDIKHSDDRGDYCEFVKTASSGQFGYFTINKSKVRGKHYHNTKSERFVIVNGRCKYTARNILTNEIYTSILSSDNNVQQIVETVPGWTHQLENIGETTVIGLVWASEVFDRDDPDTFFLEI